MQKQVAVFTAGMLSGFLNWLPGIPFDVVKTQMQSDLNPNKRFRD